MDAPDQGGIHDEHPFATPVEQRDPIRRLRGRLTAPVTVLTAGTATGRAGLTVSSIMVAEGEPPLLYCLIGPTTDLFLAVEETGRFIVHVCDEGDRADADIFAGIRPSPGGVFHGREVHETDHGPRLGGYHTYATCTVQSIREESYVALVVAELDEVVIGELDDPLAYFRGEYRRLGS